MIEVMEVSYATYSCDIRRESWGRGIAERPDSSGRRLLRRDIWGPLSPHHPAPEDRKTVTRKE